MKLQINVTKEILVKSKMCGFDSVLNAPENCAIALAVRDIFPKAQVSPVTIYTEGVNILLPDEAMLFISDFDEANPSEREEMKPFSFEIEIPEAVIERINIDEVREVLTTSPCLKLIEDEVMCDSTI